MRTQSPNKCVLKSITSVIQNSEKTQSKESIIQLLQKAIKSRSDSYDQFILCNRNDLAVIEQDEIKVLSMYLPEKVSHDELNRMIDLCLVDGRKIVSIKDVGVIMNLMGPLMAKCPEGSIDKRIVSELIKSRIC